MAVISRTATQIIQTAYRACGGMMAAQGASADLKAEGLDILNMLLDGALQDVGLVYSRAADIYTLTANLQVYKIGPAQVAPHFAAERPMQIEEANILLTTSPVVRVPCAVINGGPGGAEAWASIQLRDMNSTIPRFLYYDPTAGDYGTINLWGGPGAGYQLELFTWKQLREFADLTTSYSLPPGYAEWMGWELAEKWAPSLLPFYMKGSTKGVMDRQLAMITLQRNRTRAQIQSYNSHPPILEANPLYQTDLHRGGWNYFTGSVGGSF